MLKEISSNSRKGGIVKFAYTAREDIPGDSAITVINVYDGFGDRLGNDTYYSTTPTKSIELNYLYPAGTSGSYGSGNPSIGKRMFLVGASIDEQGYQFFYNDLFNLPDRLSYAQDDYGFYNGKTGNATLIPKPMQGQYINAFSSYGFANRHPDWNFSKMGQLSKVVYPTGGFDSLEYEANTGYSTAPPNCDISDSTKNVYVEGTSTLHHVDTYYSAPFHITCPQQVAMSIGCLPLHTPLYPGSYLVVPYLLDADSYYPTGAVQLHDTNGNPVECVENDDHTVYVNLPAGNYKIALRVEGDDRGSLNFDYNSSTATNGNKEVAGVRVKKIISYDPVTQLSNIKNYAYNDLSSGHSTGVLLDTLPLYTYAYKTFHQFSDGTSTHQKTCFYTLFHLPIILDQTPPVNIFFIIK